nr:cardiolipin synthase ClsB [Hydrogenophaga palleronii]
MSATPPAPVARAARHAPMRGGHQLLLLQGGEAFFPSLVQAMDAARTVVHLETYIFEFAGSALSVAEALERAAQRGVVVRLLVDGVGTPQVPAEWVQRFAAAGVTLRTYAPLGRLGLLLPSRWRRLHRKLCVVDGVVGFCGGINIIDDQDDVVLGRLNAPRLDFALRVAGPLVDDMVEAMEQLWWRMLAARRVRQREFKAAWDALRASRPVGDFTRLLQKIETDVALSEPALLEGPFPETSPFPLGVDSARATLLLRDNVSHRHDIERAYLKAIGAARHEIVICNAYFIPGRKLRRALTVAAARGVRVRLLLQGKYERFMQYRAARPVYQQLVDAGIEIHEYAPSALHAKVAVIDRRWSTVGSTNLDPLSMLLAREANVMTNDRRFSGLLHTYLDGLLQHAGQVLNAQTLSQRPWRQRLLDRIAFGIMRATLFVTGHRY